jgi:hypothetical protein
LQEDGILQVLAIVVALRQQHGIAQSVVDAIILKEFKVGSNINRYKPSEALAMIGQCLYLYAY